MQDYLRTVQHVEFGVSRAALTTHMRFVNGAQQFAGYYARISFRISLAELDRADEIAEGLVAAGMNEIERISFETSKLKEERAEARRMAVALGVSTGCRKVRATCTRSPAADSPLTLPLTRALPRPACGGGLGSGATAMDRCPRPIC